MEAVDQRELAVSTFGRVWELLELPERTPAQVDEMIHAAHVSCYVWSKVGAPANRARGEWQCARVYATLGHAEPALWHARRCLELTEAGGEGFEDWDLPGAQQSMAHAHLAAGEIEEARRWGRSRGRVWRASRTRKTARSSRARSRSWVCRGEAWLALVCRWRIEGEANLAPTPIWRILEVCVKGQTCRAAVFQPVAPGT